MVGVIEGLSYWESTVPRCGKEDYLVMKSVIVYNALVIVKKKNEKTKQNKNDNLPKSLA